MAKVSEHTNEHVNVLNVFYDLKSYTRRTPSREFTKLINVFRGENLTLFTVTSIRNIRKGAKNRNSETRWNPRCKATAKNDPTFIFAWFCRLLKSA